MRNPATACTAAGFAELEIFPGLQGAFEGGRRNEAHGLRCLDLHRGASLWVAACASSALNNLEGAETDELDVAALHAFGDRGQHSFKCVAGGALGCFTAEVFLDEFDEFSFIHGMQLFLFVVGVVAFPQTVCAAE